ncbi:MAG: hypothetical protein KJ077_11260 [Anaerolineae bacterium]|nr:hypothetical protein [Anaerolineae bacterium]
MTDTWNEKIAQVLEPVRVIEFQPGSRYLVVVATAKNLHPGEVARLKHEVESNLKPLLDGILFRALIISGAASFEVYRVLDGSQGRVLDGSQGRTEVQPEPGSEFEEGVHFPQPPEKRGYEP